MGTNCSAIALVASGILGAGCLSEPQGTDTADINSSHGAKQVNLISDQKGVARNTDPNLVNSWGIALDAEGLFWIADNGTGKITIVDRNGMPSQGEYKSDQFDLGEGIDGIVRNDSRTLELHQGNDCAIADFMVASEGGQIFGINGDLNPKTGILFADESAVGAVFKGLAIVDDHGETHVLAADFHNARIDAFDDKGMMLSTKHLPVPCTAPFTDPNMMPGFAPFNVVAIDDKVYVTYAKQDAMAHDDVAGPGLGAISVFDTSGNFLARVATGGVLNSPWAVTQIGSQLVVGNFGDGHISLFDATTFKSRGQVTTKGGAPIMIDGLWGLVPAGGKTLYFAAGPDGEAHGLFGFLAL